MGRAGWLITVSAVLVGCGWIEPDAGARGSTSYKIRIFGETKAVLDRHIVAQGAAFDSGPFIRGGWYVNYLATDSLEQLMAVDGSVVLSTEERPEASVRMQPYICGEMGEFWTERNEGTSAIETHEVLLTDSGEWKLNTDFSRHLFYDCKLKVDGGNDVSASTYFAQANRCDSPEAEGTQIDIQAVGLPSLVPDTCLTHINDIDFGNFSIILSFVGAGSGLDATFSDCFTSSGPPDYPITYRLGDGFPDPSCAREGSSAELYGDAAADAGFVSVKAAELIWTVQSAELVDGGRQTSDIAAKFVFSEEPEQSYTVTAHVTGPLYRIPIEGDGI